MTEQSRRHLWSDEDEWLDFFRENECGHPELAEQVSRIWFALLGNSVRTKARQGSSDSETGLETHITVYLVIPSCVPALQAGAFRVCEAGRRTRAVADTFDHQGASVHRRIARSQAGAEGLRNRGDRGIQGLARRRRTGGTNKRANGEKGSRSLVHSRQLAGHVILVKISNTSQSRLPVEKQAYRCAQHYPND
jgi:hypothetical protein